MRENLESFIVERLLDLDPTLSSASGSAIYTKVVNPLLSRLGVDPLSVDVRQFILTRLQDEFPNVDYTSPASAIRDLFTVPLIHMLEPLQMEVEFARKQRSIADAAAMSEDELDAILANMFAFRSPGEYAYTTVRVFFSNPRSFSVDGSIVFFTSGGVEFVPDRSNNYLASGMSRSGNLYYVDIPVRSVLQSESAQVPKDAIQGVRGLDGAVRVTNLAGTDGGRSRESNEEFVASAERSLSERSLNTSRGVEGLRKVFPDIVSIDVVGYGDPNMQRDVLQGEVEVTIEPSPGPVLCTTNRFATIERVVGFPLSNQLHVLKSAVPAAAMVVGNFVRIADGGGIFSDPMLSRARRISAVEVVDVSGTDHYLVTLDDFDIYRASGGAPVAVQAPAEDTRGFNHYSRQGSAYQLTTVAQVDDVDTRFIIGAPLPFEESVRLDGSLDAPLTAIPGRDFLIVRGPEASAPSFRCYPIHSRHADGTIILSRMDSFLASKQRLSYQGASSYQYAPSMDVMLEGVGTEVVAFGGPALSNEDAEARFDGITKESWGRAPGVRLSVGTNPGDRCSITLEPSMGGWDQYGVRTGQYIAVARYDDDGGAFTGTLADSTPALIWHAWGRITRVVAEVLVVEGLDWGVAPAYDAAKPYSLFWTVYQGETEAVALDGTQRKSFADQVFPPAYRTPASSLNEVNRPYGSLMLADGTFTASLALPSTTGDIWTSDYEAVWVRLGRSFYEEVPSLGTSPVQALQSTMLTDLTLTAMGSSARRLYSQLRYGGTLVSNVISLPLVEGALALSDVTGTPDVEVVTPDALNMKRTTGFLLPAGITSPASQLLQVFSAISESADARGIRVSGVPSSLPFLDPSSPNLLVRDNQVHIGGMTDVYVKASAPVAAATGSIILQPQSLIPSETGDVLCGGRDGAVDVAYPGWFFSQDLLAYLSDRFSLGSGQAYLDDLVVELVGAPALSPQFFRILHNVAGGVRIDGTFDTTSRLTNLKWRLMRACTTSLTDPQIVYQEGGDARAVANESEILCASSFNLPVDPSVIQLYVWIDSGPNRGEYTVLGGSLDRLVVDRILQVSDSGMRYRVYAKQSAPIQLPLVRVKDVTLASGEVGVAVPYRHPVDIVASSFSGINDDPITSSSGHLLEVEGRLVLEDENVDFVSRKVTTYDVVRMEDMDDPARYFQVQLLVDGDANRVVLDRIPEGLSLPITGVRYTIGHPAVGTARVVLKNRTFLEMGPDAVLSYVDGSGRTVKFRPSPAESAVIFRSAQASTDVTIETQSGQLRRLRSPSGNFLGQGVSTGDEVTILTRVLQSDVFQLAETTDMEVAGQVLVLQVAGVRQSVVLSGAGTTTLAAIATDITNQTGRRVGAAVVGLRLVLSCRDEMSIPDVGSTGLLTRLKLQGVGGNTVGATGVVESVAYDADTGDALIVMEGAVTVPTSTALFVSVSRPSVQRLYPGLLSQNDTLMYEGVVKLTSYDPFARDVTTAGQQLTATGYRSFGYELQVEDANYSFSMAERVSIVVTPIMLDELAESMVDAIPLTGAAVVVGYESSPTVGSIQSYMLQPAVRVTNHNPLVRHFFPAYAVASILYGGSVGVDVVRARVAAFLGGLYPNRPLEVFDLSTTLERAGASYVRFPQQAAFLTQDEWRVERLARSEDVVRLDPKYHIMEDLSSVIIEAV